LKIFSQISIVASMQFRIVWEQFLKISCYHTATNQCYFWQ